MNKKRHKRVIYTLDNRCRFIDKVVSLREGNKRKDGLTYKGVADKMNLLGFRNRNADEITAQFVGNILNRYT